MTVVAKGVLPVGVLWLFTMYSVYASQSAGLAASFAVKSENRQLTVPNSCMLSNTFAACARLSLIDELSPRRGIFGAFVANAIGATAKQQLPRGAARTALFGWSATAPCYDDEGAEYPSDESEDNLMNPLADGKGVVLITGGLGGLGIVTAEAVVEAGAPCVVLASRSGKVKYSDQGLDERLEALRACGAKVVLERCDTSIEADVEATLKRVRKHGPLRVVVHAAGTLSDGLLPAQDSTSVQKVWGPKADGAWFLHKHTANNDQCLGAFIVYSSVSSLFGGVGQANYSAANAYLDELVR